MFAIFACSKEEKTEIPNAKQPVKPAPTAASIDKAQAVKKAEKPKTEKIQGTQAVKGKTVHSSTQNAGMSADAKAKLKILTSGSRLKADAPMECWYISKVNDVDVSGADGNDYLYFFDEDGSYYVYDMSTDNWDWGFFYISDDMSVVALDVKPDGTASEFWLITTLTDAKIELTDESNKVLFESIDLSGYDEEEITLDEAKTKIADKVWFWAYDYTDGKLDEFNEDAAGAQITTVYFEKSGILLVQQFTINPQTGDATEVGKIEGTWLLNATGALTIKYTEDTKPVEKALEVNYLADNELSVTDWDDDGKVTISEFLTETAFVEEIVKEIK